MVTRSSTIDKIYGRQYFSLLYEASTIYHPADILLERYDDKDVRKRRVYTYEDGLD
jgi:hypothetical protein